jgi:hypothetical protein
MTTVYGVTFIGAREQIEKQLKDRKDIPEEDCWPAASYLAKRVGIFFLCIARYIHSVILHRPSHVSVICSAAPKASKHGSIYVHASFRNLFLPIASRRPWRLKYGERAQELLTANLQFQQLD